MQRIFLHFKFFLFQLPVENFMLISAICHYSLRKEIPCQSLSVQGWLGFIIGVIIIDIGSPCHHHTNYTARIIIGGCHRRI